MKWSVRNTRVETELRGLIPPRLLLVMNKLQKLLAGNGTVIKPEGKWMHLLPLAWV